MGTMDAEAPGRAVKLVDFWPRQPAASRQPCAPWMPVLTTVSHLHLESELGQLCMCMCMHMHMYMCMSMCMCMYVHVSLLPVKVSYTRVFDLWRVL